MEKKYYIIVGVCLLILVPGILFYPFKSLAINNCENGFKSLEPNNFVDLANKLCMPKPSEKSIDFRINGLKRMGDYDTVVESKLNNFIPNSELTKNLFCVYEEPISFMDVKSNYGFYIAQYIVDGDNKKVKPLMYFMKDPITDSSTSSLSCQNYIKFMLENVGDNSNKIVEFDGLSGKVYNFPWEDDTKLGEDPGMFCNNDVTILYGGEIYTVYADYFSECIELKADINDNTQNTQSDIDTGEKVINLFNPNKCWIQNIDFETCQEILSSSDCVYSTEEECLQSISKVKTNFFDMILQFIKKFFGGK